MRITLGMSLEAWVPTDAAAPPMAMGAWRAGEVVWGNGHSYVMRWFDGGPDSGRILRKFVRPIPDPAVKLPADLVPGDNVEVLDGSLWKWAEVVAAADDQFEVKIVGSSQVLTADRGALRPRQVYGEKGWVVLHKGNKIPVESVVPSRPIPGKNINGKASNGNNLGGGKFAAPHAVKLGGTTTTKRSSCSVMADGDDVVPDAKRFHFHSSSRLFPKEARGLHSSSKLFPKEARGLHSSIKLFPKDARYPSHCYLMKKRRQETSNDNKSYNEESCDVVGGTVRDSSDTDDGSSSSSTSDRSSSSADGSDGDSSSSSGSNSNGGVPEFPAAGERCQENREASIPPPPRSREEEEQDSDDGRASVTMDHRRRVDEDEEEAVTTMKRDRQAAEVHEDHGSVVHGLELEAYVSVMKAFRATGPLSWAKEELLSDLRLHLHVSGDEHLQLIRSLNGNS